MSVWDKYECEGQLSIFDILTPAEEFYMRTGRTDFWQQSDNITFVDDKPVLKECKFSGHTCNKEELWKVAEGLDNIECKKVCCRQCKVLGCGARCNGAPEPSKCNCCFHEDQGKCWCFRSEYFDKPIPEKPCDYLDLC